VLVAIAASVVAAATIVVAAPAVAESVEPAQPPVIASITPPVISSSGGTRVEIDGAGFTTSSLVEFYDSSGTQLASEFPTVVSATELTFTAPPFPVGPVGVAVRTEVGVSARFTITFGTTPVIDSLTPASGPATGNTSVQIRGSGFTGTTAVRFGSAAASFVVNSDASISAEVPAGTGSVDVTVTTPIGTSAPVSFGYLDATVGDPSPSATASIPASAASPAPATLAATGAGGPQPLWVLVAVTLIGAGVLLLLRRARGGVRTR